MVLTKSCNLKEIVTEKTYSKVKRAISNSVFYDKKVKNVVKLYQVKWKTASLYGNVTLTDTNSFIKL